MKLALYISFSLILFTTLVQGKTLVQESTEIITDPFKIGEASENVESSVENIVKALDRTLLNIKDIQSETDQDIRDYLDQIDSIVERFNNTITETGDRVETNLISLANEVRELENKTYKDAIDLIWRAQCSANVVIEETAKKALADMVNKIKKADPKFYVFGLPTGKVKIDNIDISDPDIVYRAIKKNRIAFLNNNLHANDDAYIIKSTYSNLARLAKLTQCHYIGQNLEMDFIRERYEFERLAAPWHFISL